MRRLVPIPNLIDAARIHLILEDADHALSVINSEFVDQVAEYRGPNTTATRGRHRYPIGGLR